MENGEYETEAEESSKDEMSKSQRKKEAFSNLRYDYKRARDAKSIIDNLIVEWNDLYYGKKKESSSKQKSQIIMKEIAKQIEWQKPNITEPFTSPSNPIRIKTAKSEDRARTMQKYLNFQFAGDREDFLDQLTAVVLREGTAWTRTGWKFEEEKVCDVVPRATMQDLLANEEEPTDIKPNKDGTFRVKYEYTEIKKNVPTLEVCRNEHVFPDPSARTMSELRYVIYKKYMTISEIKASGLYDDDAVERLEGVLNAEEREDTGLGSVRC